jgi:hypothetical protein
MGDLKRLLPVMHFLIKSCRCIAVVIGGLAGLLGTVAVSWGQSETTSAPAQGPFAPWGGTLVPDNTPPAMGLLPAKKASAGSSWLNQAAPAAITPVYETAQPVSVITPVPYTSVPGGMISAETLEQAAPPGIRVAGLTQNTVAPLNQISPEPQGQLPPGARNGVFQKIYANGTYLPAIGDEPDTLGFGELETGVVFGFPFPRRDTPLLATPQFGVHFLDNAGPLDIPKALYDSAVEFRHLRKFGGGPFAMDVSTTVGYYSDFDQAASQAVRVSGRGIGVYESSPTTKWLLGVAYLNRAGASVLPIGGVIYEPTPQVRYELVFPRPRAYWQLPGSTSGIEDWVYFGGEFGGGVWSITRPSTGDLDLLSYSDWRLMAGYEHKIIGGVSTRFEGGYVFNRQLDFKSATPDVSLDDTIFVRLGMTY